MPARVIIPPDPLLTPADVPGSHAADDASVAAMIAACTAVVDGPSGWLGRSFGPQTIEVTFRCWDDVSRLPYGPVIDVISVSYVDTLGDTVVVDSGSWSHDGDYLFFASGWVGPGTALRAFPIKVRYEVGYDGEDVDDGGTGPVPEQAKAAIVEAVQQIILARNEDLGIRSFTVEDVESVTYLDADKVSAIMRKSTDRLLSGLWVPSL